MSTFILPTSVEIRKPIPTTGVPKNSATIAPISASVELILSALKMNGMAAGRALEELFERAPGRYDVTIFGAEPRVNYNRIQLSPVLAGEKRYEDILIHDEDWYARNGVHLVLGSFAHGGGQAA